MVVLTLDSYCQALGKEGAVTADSSSGRCRLSSVQGRRSGYCNVRGAAADWPSGAFCPTAVSYHSEHTSLFRRVCQAVPPMEDSQGHHPAFSLLCAGPRFGMDIVTIGL